MVDYKLTPTDWIKKIPAHWKYRLVREIFEERKTKVSDKMYPALSVSKAGVVPQIDTVAKTDNGDNRKLVKIGDFVINSRSDRKGASGISDYEGSVSLIYTVLQTVVDENKKFLHYLLRSVPFTEEYYRNGKGLVSDLWTTNYDKFKNIFLPLPPLDEQEKIVRYLDKKTSQISTYINAKKKEIELLGELKRSIISEAVTKGLHSSQTPVHWKVVRLKSLFSFGKGLPITKEDLVEQGIPVISYGQVHAKNNSGTTVTDELIRFVSKSYLKTNPSSLVDEFDFIFADTSEDLEGTGNCVYVDKKMTLFAGYHTIILRARERADKKFLAYLFLTDIWRYQIRSRVSGVKVFSISKKILGQVNVLLPPLEEQREIVDYLDAKCAKIERLIEALQNEIKFVEELRTRIISDVVTGKIDVRELT